MRTRGWLAGLYDSEDFHDSNSLWETVAEAEGSYDLATLYANDMEELRRLGL